MSSVTQNSERSGRDAEDEDRPRTLSAAPNSSETVEEGSLESSEEIIKFTGKVLTLEPESISPLMLGKSKEIDPFNLDLSRVSTRNSSRMSTRKPSKASVLSSPSMRPIGGGWRTSPYLWPVSNSKASFSAQAHKTSPSLKATSICKMSPSLRPIMIRGTEDLSHTNASRRKSEFDQIFVQQGHFKAVLDEIDAWINRERKSKEINQGASKHTHTLEASAGTDAKAKLSMDPERSSEQTDRYSHSERKFEAPQEFTNPSSLDELAQIVKRGFTAVDQQLLFSQQQIRGRKLSLRRRKRGISTCSEGDSTDAEEHVPACDVALDNSKTLSYSGGRSSSAGLNLTRTRTNDAWSAFKYEIVQLAHTLRLRGWSKVPVDQSSEIDVERLCGALTNAVYVVTPPPDLPDSELGQRSRAKFPVKLLLRIYGPNADDLIDRESELQILTRLARKNIGPRLLGTFLNGRFEEYLNAKTLRSKDLRDADISIQIAKRMRELHAGIELLEKERDNGPFVWHNWYKWLTKCRKIVSFLDKQLEEKSHLKRRKSSISGALKSHPVHVCGLPWQIVEETYDKLCQLLKGKYGGSSILRKQLIFAHNDTQYGNILRVEPPGESPLLLAQNVHKQLVVIDFEYANANVPGLEFANHFTEWCYNYHDQEKPWACNTQLYPTKEQQQRFIRAYVLHRPGGPPPSSNKPTSMIRTVADTGATTNSSSPSPSPSPLTPIQTMTNPGGSSSSLSSHYAEARNPLTNETISSIEKQAEDEEAEAITQAEVKRLMYEAKLWRACNSAQWVAWGVMQAKISGMPELSDTSADSSTTPNQVVSSVQENPEEPEDEDEEFDHLSYTRDRALFFWADCYQLGLIDESILSSAASLPGYANLWEEVQTKMVRY